MFSWNIAILQMHKRSGAFPIYIYIFFFLPPLNVAQKILTFRASCEISLAHCYRLLFMDKHMRTEFLNIFLSLFSQLPPLRTPWIALELLHKANYIFSIISFLCRQLFWLNVPSCQTCKLTQAADEIPASSRQQSSVSADWRVLLGLYHVLVLGGIHVYYLSI